jgi:hypothetical protein
VLKSPKSIEFYRILQRHSPQTMRFHEDPALGRADPARLDEFTAPYQLPAIKEDNNRHTPRFVLKRPKSIEFYRILQRHSPQAMRFHEDPALGRAGPARLDEFTGSYQLPAIDVRSRARAMRFSCTGVAARRSSCFLKTGGKGRILFSSRCGREGGCSQ